MAATEHDHHKCLAQEAKIESFCAAAHALVRMANDPTDDRGESLGWLIQRLAGFHGAGPAQIAWEAMRDLARQNSGLQYAVPGTEVRQRTLGRLLETQALAATAPEDVFGHVHALAGGGW